MRTATDPFTPEDFEEAMRRREQQRAKRETPDSSDEEEIFKLSGRNIYDLMDLEIDPETNLLGNRWLTRDGSAFVIAPSGHGKSSWVMQSVCCWSIGRIAFGIHPARPLRILVLQSEDDDAESKKFAQIIRKMKLTPEEVAVLRSNTRFEYLRSLTGAKFILAVDQFLTEWPADVVVINPLSGFLLCDLKDDEKVNSFLRNDLGSVMSRHRCAPLVVHHTPKLNFTKLDNMQWYDWMYAMSGCAGLTNWGRAVLVIAPSKIPGTYRFIAAKRFDEIQWTAREYWFAHSRQVFSDNGKDHVILEWVPASEEQIAGAKPAPKNRKAIITAEMLWEKMSPLQKYSRHAFEEWVSVTFGLGEKKAWSGLKLLVEKGLAQVSTQERKGTNPLKLYEKVSGNGSSKG
jgi:hypothetical protein